MIVQLIVSRETFGVSRHERITTPLLQGSYGIEFQSVPRYFELAANPVLAMFHVKHRYLTVLAKAC